MHEFEGKIAVITGAASGIGRALADRFAAAGMRVVMADVETDALDAAAAQVARGGAEVLALRTDVSDRDAVHDLAAATIDRFGVPNIVCNNAGVSGTFGPIWEASDTDWEWVLGVNLMGVIHGIQAFVPAMVASGQPGHVVNTSSVLGLSTGGGSIYSVTKHAVTRLTEGLWYDLRAANSAVSASVLCPGLIATRIVSAGRNRPEHLSDADLDPGEAEAARQRMEAAQAYFEQAGMPPAEVADMVLDAISADRFYVLTHPDMILGQVTSRMQGILDGNPPPQDNTGQSFLARATGGQR